MAKICLIAGVLAVICHVAFARLGNTGTKYIPIRRDSFMDYQEVVKPQFGKPVPEPAIKTTRSVPEREPVITTPYSTIYPPQPIKIDTTVLAGIKKNYRGTTDPIVFEKFRRRIPTTELLWGDADHDLAVVETGSPPEIYDRPREDEINEIYESRIKLVKEMKKAEKEYFDGNSDTKAVGHDLFDETKDETRALFEAWIARSAGITVPRIPKLFIEDYIENLQNRLAKITSWMYERYSVILSKMAMEGYVLKLEDVEEIIKIGTYEPTLKEQREHSKQYRYELYENDDMIESETFTACMSAGFLKSNVLNELKEDFDLYKKVRIEDHYDSNGPKAMGKIPLSEELKYAKRFLSAFFIDLAVMRTSCTSCAFKAVKFEYHFEETNLDTNSKYKWVPYMSRYVGNLVWHNIVTTLKAVNIRTMLDKQASNPERANRPHSPLELLRQQLVGILGKPDTAAYNIAKYDVNSLVESTPSYEDFFDKCIRDETSRMEHLGQQMSFETPISGRKENIYLMEELGHLKRHTERYTPIMVFAGYLDLMSISTVWLKCTAPPLAEQEDAALPGSIFGKIEMYKELMGRPEIVTFGGKKGWMGVLEQIKYAFTFAAADVVDNEDHDRQKKPNKLLERPILPRSKTLPGAGPQRGKKSV